MKTVVSNSMVAHLWANQSQESARNGNGSFFFEGDTIYSYRQSWPIARITNKNGPGNPIRRIVLFNSDRYGITTSRHAGLAGLALHQHNVIFIAVPNVRAGLHDYRAGLHKEDHEKNLEYLTDQVAIFVKRARQARLYARYCADTAAQYVIEFDTYKAAFLPDSLLRAKIPEDLAGAIAAKMARVAARAEKSRKRRTEQYAARYAEEMKRVPLWRAGLLTSLPQGYGLPVYLRKVLRAGASDNGFPNSFVAQTSLGAEVPLVHARRVWSAVREVLRTGEAYQHNGHTIHAGAFQVDSIDVGGTLRAGCHTIQLDEMRRFAGAEGWEV